MNAKSLLCDPMDCSLQVSSVHRILHTENPRVGCRHVLLRGIFPPQGSNRGSCVCCTDRWVLSHQHDLEAQGSEMRVAESPGTWPGWTPSRGGRGAAAPRPSVAPPFTPVQGPLSVLRPRGNFPDHEPRAALGPANCSWEKEPQECLPDCTPGLLTGWLRTAVPKPFTTWDWFRGRQRFHEWRGDGFRMVQAYYIYCALCFYYCYISSTSDHPKH